MEMQIKRMLTEIKNILRKKIKKCDVCGGKKFDFRYDEYIEDLVWMRCEYCGRTMYLGTGEDAA